MKLIRLIFTSSLLIILSAAAYAYVSGPPVISVVVHEQENGADEGILIHITNFQGEAFEFERLEIQWLEETTPHSFIVQDFRDNALCPCNEICTNELIVMKPWETRNVYWDKKDNSCQIAKPGKYQVEAVGKCDYDGCTGAYYPTNGNEFDLR